MLHVCFPYRYVLSGTPMARPGKKTGLRRIDQYGADTRRMGSIFVHQE
ncbi:hypothetical protein GXY_11012 [Novacetimonas hansenii ATCC 23769]|uniref:Uncharacterized protein n=1 Tax=Novacetimonas hansenii ATCC 23769 TaxID=714995 RepID=D5QGD1_NOVHA|nr:hypothetical protein GXY_11012 [Novacetimonas hansenii ATCC 23769]